MNSKSSREHGIARRSSRFTWFWAIAAIALAPASEAAVRVATGVDRAAVQAAVDLAVNGDTVQIPAGSATWTQCIITDKGISIIGAGVGLTIIRDNVDRDLTPFPTGSNSATREALFAFNTVAGRSYRLSGMTITDAPASRAAAYSNGIVQFTGNSKLCRMDNIRFEFPSGSKHLRFVYWLAFARGVMHDVIWNITGEQAFAVFHSTWGGGVNGEGSWAAPDLAGTDEMVVCEDSQLLGADNGGLTDGFGGARFCVRRCIIRNGHIATHGTESTGRARGTRWVEIYENTFQHPLTGANGQAVDYRSGSGVVFNNTGTGGHQTPVHLSNYRDVDHFTPWGMADGRNPYDQNDLNGGPAGNPTPFVTGTHNGPNLPAAVGTILTDTTKTWTVNQWQNYILHRMGPTGAAAAGSGSSSLVVSPSQGWATNQFVGWTLKNETTGRVRLITANTADTVTVAAGDGPLTFAVGDGFSIYFPKHITSNTATTISVSPTAFTGLHLSLNTGDAYRIYRTLTPLDMPGMGQSTSLGSAAVPTPVAWPTQAVSPIYIWGNSFAANDAGTPVTTFAAARPPILMGTHAFVGTPKPGYTPLVYPHPLRVPTPPSDLTISAAP